MILLSAKDAYEKHSNKIPAYISCAALLVCLFLIPIASPIKICTVATQSMEPEYKAGSVVIIAKCPLSKLKIGDVIAFKSAAIGGRTAFHRVVRITDNGVCTKGDSCALEDGAVVTAENLVGKKILHTAAFARFFCALRSTNGKVKFLLLPLLSLALLVFGSYLLKRAKGKY